MTNDDTVPADRAHAGTKVSQRTHGEAPSVPSVPKRAQAIAGTNQDKLDRAHARAPDVVGRMGTTGAPAHTPAVAAYADSHRRELIALTLDEVDGLLQLLKMQLRHEPLPRLVVELAALADLARSRHGSPR